MQRFTMREKFMEYVEYDMMTTSYKGIERILYRKIKHG